MVLSQESIRSLLSQKIIPIPAYSYVSWGIISSAMIISTMFFTQPYEVFSILAFGCLLGIIFNVWDVARYNVFYELFKFNKQQKDSIVLLIFFLIFAICLTMFFVHNNTPNFITFVWMFVIGVFNYIVGSSSSKSLLLSYGILLIIFSISIFIGIMFVDTLSQPDSNLILSVLNVVVLGFGHIFIGIYYAIKQKKILHAK
ncbi:hypothetical protein MNB_ARC-1_531 [hydrothermal vent metagenome]|uniref:Uncharacterized protein n=1 Tax=hydrothermal vent metagenome TaxID=652676 RepID=A0A3B1E5K4_9ZZZZ